VTALPVAVPVAMRATFPALAGRYGRHRGYLAGFGVYWALCFGIPLALLGPRGTVALVAAGRPLRAPAPAVALILAGPPAGSLLTEFAPALAADRRAARLIPAAAAIATVNAAAEELLWRGLAVAVFPGDPIRGWLWPAAGFAAWHLAPLSVLGSRRGPRAFIAASATIGVGLGWVAQRTGSLRLPLMSHIATDAMGLRAYRFWLTGAAAPA